MNNPARIEEVLKFWFDELSPDDWFEGEEAGMLAPIIRADWRGYSLLLFQ